MTSYCVFNVGERRVGIPLAHVREIIEHQLIVPTPIPLTPPFIQGLFNLRGQVLPFLDLASFVGAQEKSAAPGRQDRAVIVERGPFRFATTGRRIDTIDADPGKFTPLESGVSHPALEAEANTDYGRFHVLHLDRLEACLVQSLKQTAGSPAPGATITEGAPPETPPAPAPAGESTQR